ncbi:MAG: ester cyclase [Acidobacteriota bacterium]|jgi:predicted SnoaL-like aldol condensation-catalyzing enzyme|nr:ester cyclase [Acidobacteriota bacterium]
MGTAQENKRLIEDFAQKVFVDHELDGLEAFIREDYIQHNADCAQGLEGFLDFFITIFSAVPDFRYEIRQIVAEGDLVWMWSRTLGTHTGGPWLGVAPGGQELDFDVIDMFRIQDGKIAEHWDVADTHTFFTQLGRFA